MMMYLGLMCRKGTLNLVERERQFFVVGQRDGSRRSGIKLVRRGRKTPETKLPRDIVVTWYCYMQFRGH